jgi:hypothetical protein
MKLPMLPMFQLAAAKAPSSCPSPARGEGTVLHGTALSMIVECATGLNPFPLRERVAAKRPGEGEGRQRKHRRNQDEI